MVKVEAPWRMSMKGQSTSGCALATGCGVLSDAPEKKFAILSLKEGEPDGAGAPGGGAGGGAVEAVVPAGTGVVATPILPLPVQPGASRKIESRAADRYAIAHFVV